MMPVDVPYSSPTMSNTFSNILASLVAQFLTLEDTYLDLSGKTVIVTGANAGLGKESAKKFAAMNPARLVSFPLNAVNKCLPKNIIHSCGI